jgi:hypothetical protein
MPMRIFVFKSETKQELRAFTDDVSGFRLPNQLGPWTAIGVISQDAKPPHRFSRDQIESSISASGFQLWRFKAKNGGQPN